MLRVSQQTEVVVAAILFKKRLEVQETSVAICDVSTEECRARIAFAVVGVLSTR